MAEFPSDWIRRGPVNPPDIPKNAMNGEIIKPEPIKGNITGAGYLAGLFRQRIADTKATLANAGNELNAAVKDLEDVATQAVNQVKAVKAETADLKAALGLNSNGDPE